MANNINRITEEQEQKNHEWFIWLRGIMLSEPEKFESELEKALADGFPIDYTDENGRTLAHWLVDSITGTGSLLLEIDPSYPDPLSVLKNKGAKLNIKDKEGLTPLDIARKNYISDGNPMALDVCDVLENEYSCNGSDELLERFPHSEPAEQKRYEELKARIEHLKEQKAKR